MQYHLVGERTRRLLIVARVNYKQVTPLSGYHLDDLAPVAIVSGVTLKHTCNWKNLAERIPSGLDSDLDSNLASSDLNPPENSRIRPPFQRNHFKKSKESLHLPTHQFIPGRLPGSLGQWLGRCGSQIGGTLGGVSSIRNILGLVLLMVQKSGKQGFIHPSWCRISSINSRW